MQRVGNVCSLALKINTLNANLENYTPIVNIPYGYRPTAHGATTIGFGSDGIWKPIGINVNGDVIVGDFGINAVGWFVANFTYITNDAPIPA